MRKVVIVFVLLFLAPVSYAELVVSYRSPATSSTYHIYYTKLIALALEKTRASYGDYTLMSTPPSTSTLRALSDVNNGVYPNLLIELSYDENITNSGMLTYIDFPIDGGILGYRVCFVRPDLKDKVEKSKSLDDLRKYTIGQGVGWADNEILRANGFNVMEIANYNNIFKMVVGGRVDLFCRGANQLKPELDEFKELNLSYDESFLLVYPMPRFFYLNSKNQVAKKTHDGRPANCLQRRFLKKTVGRTIQR